MLKKILSFALFGLMSQLALGLAPVATRAQTNAAGIPNAANTRAKVVAFGTTKRVAVRREDHSRVVGRIKQINEDNFVVADTSGAEFTIPYAHVTEIKAHGNGLPKIVIVVIVLSAVGVIGGLLNPS
ncbi:MAG TPA: hypothetical protein VIW64_05705 [Pyrinomonadaceae bacterium]|jgi:hypothetical protein